MNVNEKCNCEEISGMSIALPREVERSVRLWANRWNMPVDVVLADPNWRQQLPPKTRRALEDFQSGARHVWRMTGHIDTPPVLCPIHGKVPQAQKRSMRSA